MGYTLTQVDALLSAVDRQESERLATLLTVIATGSQGSNDAIRKLAKALDAQALAHD